MLIDHVKISHKERKKQERSDRCPLFILQEMMLFVILELWSWEEGNLKRAKELTGTVWSRKQHEPSRSQQAAVRGESVTHTAHGDVAHQVPQRENTRLGKY